MKPFSDHTPIRFLAEWMFALFIFLMLWLVYDIARDEFDKKPNNDNTQWHLIP